MAHRVSRRIGEPREDQYWHWRDAQWKVRLGRPYLAITVSCKQHPLRRLALFGCKLDESPVTPERVLYVVKDEELDAHASKVHIRCGSDCRLDEQWRKDRVAALLTQYRDTGRVGVVKLYL